MFDSIKKWARARKMQAEQDSYMRGYNYAAGQLVMHGLSVKTALLNEIAHGYDAWRPFDVGMSAAIHDYCVRTRGAADGGY